MNLTGNGRAEVRVPPKGAAESSGPGPDDPRVIAALEEYALALKVGQAPDREAFLARHPEIAAVLAECLDGLEFVQQARAPMRSSADDEAVAAAAGARLGALLGDYRLLREVGRGGMGVVYEAEQLSLNRRVALKVLPFVAALDAKQLQRFKNEAQAAAHLHHTNIVPVYAVGCERGVHYYAMQFIDGQSLAALIQELRQSAGLEVASVTTWPGLASSLAGELASGSFAPGRPDPQATGLYAPPPGSPDTKGPGAAAAPTAGPAPQPAFKGTAFVRTVAHLGVQAAEALEHAHQLGVVHRDIKPANLLLDVRGNLWVTDFGLAHFQSQAIALTSPGDLLGTLRYMSPEQALAQRVPMDHRTDIYSLGVTLYELLTLEPAFDGRDRQELLRQIACEEPCPPRRRNRSIPAELETVVLKAMDKSPAERYGTAQDLADDLRRFLEDRPVRARRPTLWQRLARWSRRHKPVMLMVAVSAVLLLVMAVAGLAVNNRLLDRERKQTLQQRDLAEAQRQEAERRRLIAEANFQRARALIHNAPLKEQLTWLEGPGRRRARQENWEKVLALFRGLVTEPGPEPGDRLLTAQVHSELADAYFALERPAEAAREYQKAIALLRSLVAEFPKEAGFRNSLARCLARQGWSRLDRADPLAGEEEYRQAIALYEGLRQEFRDVPWYRMQLVWCWTNVGELRRRTGRFPQAEEAFRRALALLPQLYEEFPQASAGVLAKTDNDLAWVLVIRPDRQPHHAAAALEHAQQAVALAPGYADYVHTLGVAHCRLGHWKEALAAMESSRQLSRGRPDSYDRFFEAMAYSGLGDRENARRCYDEGVRWMEEHAPDHPDLRRFRTEAAQTLGTGTGP